MSEAAGGIEPMVWELLLIVAVMLCLALCAWLANDLLWDRWEAEKEKTEARRLTQLIALNLVACVIGGAGLLVLAFRASVW